MNCDSLSCFCGIGNIGNESSFLIGLLGLFGATLLTAGIIWFAKSVHP